MVGMVLQNPASKRNGTVHNSKNIAVIKKDDHPSFKKDHAIRKGASAPSRRQQTRYAFVDPETGGLGIPGYYACARYGVQARTRLVLVLGS